MSRVRKQLITNLYLKDKDIKRLANGYVMYKRANKHAHALIPRQVQDNTRKADELKVKIAYHQRLIDKFMGKLPEEMITKKLLDGGKKRKYNKKNTAYWAKGGGAAKWWNRPISTVEERS